MSAQGQTSAFPRSAAPALGLILIVVAVITGLATLDSFLAKTEQTELRSEASQSHIAGLDLLRQGKTAAAVDALRKAHSLERGNLDYEVDLVNAFVADGKTNEARPLMNEILEEEPNEGRANLAAAHLMAKIGNLMEAESYYHRAIYGEWQVDADGHRTAARLELIDFLIANGQQHELLAELLPLEEQAGTDWKLQEKLAHLFVVTGSPARAADIFHSLIQHHRGSAGVYGGLGEAELESGDFHAAHSAFSTASRLNPEDASLRNRLNLCAALTALDPTPRWLSWGEKYHRSLQILQLATNDLEHCIVNHSAVATSEANELITSAHEALSRKPGSVTTNEVSEGLLAIAERLWEVRTKSCGSATTSETEPLKLMMEKLSKPAI